MMNALQKYILETRERERTVLNELTERGVISDNCVGAGDVAAGDCARCFGALFPPREFALTRRGEWLTDPYPPGAQSWPKAF